MILDLLRYQVIAVLQYSVTPDALYLQHPRQLHNLVNYTWTRMAADEHR